MVKLAQDEATLELKAEGAGASAAAVAGAPPRPQDPDSGDIAVHLLDLAAGSRVARATAAVTGATFHGKLVNLQGARVSASPVVYTGGGATGSPTASRRAFIVDFASSVSVLGLELGGGGAITLVLPWLGTDFSPRPAYPAGQEKSNPSPSGADRVGLSGLETQKLLVQVENPKSLDEATFADRLVITTGTFPANVRASLDGRLPFWTKPGPLAGTIELTGLAEDLNALLAGADDDVSVVITLTTDAPGVLKLDFDPAADAAVDRSAEARWGADPSTDVPVVALEPATVPVPFPTESTTPWNVTRLIVEASGAFPPWRAQPAQATAAPGHLGLKVDAAFSVARRVEVEQDAELHGVALPLRAPGDEAELHVELVPDHDGSPATGKPLAAAGLTPAPAPEPAWHEVPFSFPVALQAGAACWLVVQAKTGAAEWVAAAEAPVSGTRTLGASQGGRWGPFPAVAGAAPVAQARILRRPFATENEPSLELAWDDGEGSPVRLDAGREPTTIELMRPSGEPLATSTHVAALRVTATTSGTLTLERVTALYEEATALDEEAI